MKWVQEFFRGMMPRRADRKLPEGYSAFAQETRLWSQELRPNRLRLYLQRLLNVKTVMSVYPFTYNDVRYFMSWDRDVDVALAPMPTTDEGRVYFTGQGQLAYTNNELAYGAGVGPFPETSYRAGVIPPPLPATVSVVGGSGGAETRSYVYTFITPLGEESAPSPPDEFVGNDTYTHWLVSGLPTQVPGPSPAISFTSITGTEALVVTTAAEHYLEAGDSVSFTVDTVLAKDALGIGTAASYSYMTGPTGLPSASTVCIVSFWFLAANTPNGSDLDYMVWAAGPSTWADPVTDGVSVIVTAEGAVQFRAAQGGDVVELQTDDGIISTNSTSHILISYNTVAGVGAIVLDHVVCGLVTETIDALSLDWTGWARYYVFGIGQATSPSNVSGGVSEMYVNPDEYLDFSLAVNQDKFSIAVTEVLFGTVYRARLPGTEAVNLTGTAAAFYYNYTDAGEDWTVNEGAAGATGYFLPESPLIVSNGSVYYADRDRYELNGVCLSVLTAPTTTTFTVTFPPGSLVASGTGSVARTQQINGISDNDLQKRIYRTDAAGVFRYVGTAADGDATYEDTVANADLGAELQTADWVGPPPELHSVHAMSDGTLVAAAGNRICFCEPDQPHAWPEAYRYPVPAIIVTVRVFGSTVVALTDGTPFLVTGGHPRNKSVRKIDVPYACLSKRGVTDVIGGVIYPAGQSPIMLEQSGASMIGHEFLSADEWVDYTPSDMLAVTYQGRFHAFHGEWTETYDQCDAYEFVPPPEVIEWTGLVFDPRTDGAEFIRLEERFQAAYSDRETEEMFVVDSNNEIYQFNEGVGDTQGYYVSRVHTSGTYFTPGAARVFWTPYSSLTQNQYDTKALALTTNLNDRLDPASQLPLDCVGFTVPGEHAVAGGLFTKQTQGACDPSVIGGFDDTGECGTGVTFSLFARNITTGEFEAKIVKSLTNDVAFSLPQGYRSREFYWELSVHRAQVHAVVFAESMEELAA